MRTTRHGRTPTAWPAANRLALLLALALVAVAVVAVRDLLVALDQAPGQPWLPEVPRALDGLTASTAVATVGAVLAVVGVVLVVLAMVPARRTHVAVSDEDGLWLTPGAVASLAATAADRAEGVVATDVRRVSRRRVVVDVTARRGRQIGRASCRERVS